MYYDKDKQKNIINRRKKVLDNLGVGGGK